MSDSLFWHVVAIGALGLLAAIAVLLVLNIRKHPSSEVLGSVNRQAKPTVDGDVTLTAFNVLCDRDAKYANFERPNHDLLDTENLKDYAPQLREFSENILSLAAPIPEVHLEGVDPLLVNWDNKVTAWYASAAEHQSDHAALIERAVAHDDSQTVVSWIIDSAIGFMSYDPLVKVREIREAGKFFEEETVKIMERQERLINQREAYLAELNRLKSVYEKRWGWPLEK